MATGFGKCSGRIVSFGIESILVASGAGVSVVGLCLLLLTGLILGGFLGAFQPILGTQLALMLDRTFQTDEAIVTHLHLLETGQAEEQPQVTEISRRIAALPVMSGTCLCLCRVRTVAAGCSHCRLSHSLLPQRKDTGGESIRTGDHSTTRPSR